MWEHFLLLFSPISSLEPLMALPTTNTAGKTVFQRAALGSGSFQRDRKKQQTQGA